jgi:hypothetical protein
MNFNLYNMLINPLNELSHSTSYFDIVSSILLMIILYSVILLLAYFCLKSIFWVGDHIFLKPGQSAAKVLKKSFIPKHVDMSPIFLYSYSGVTNSMVEPVEIDDIYQLEVQVQGQTETITVDKESYDKYNIGEECHVSYSQCVISKKIESVVLS